MWRQELSLRAPDCEPGDGRQRHGALGVRVRRSEVLGGVAHVRAAVAVDERARGAGRGAQAHQVRLAARAAKLPVGRH